ncbi:MAG: zinc ribbon domain-containing protein [Myxococcaceae bacterium]|nr:zinc ribbon domain-containing protein [Myxococcaceae bacterium]MBH2006312.1 zinc ribbon domain-containing protein [Myxococcaceae bacterium]
MPIYEFRCKYCHNQQEVLQKINDPAPKHCSACEKESGMEKVVSHTSFQLKGGGWYSEGYASSKPSCNQEGCSPDKPACQSAS